jgi:hypothetical protein
MGENNPRKNTARGSDKCDRPPIRSRPCSSNAAGYNDCVSISIPRMAR